MWLMIIWKFVWLVSISNGRSLIKGICSCVKLRRIHIVNFWLLSLWRILITDRLRICLDLFKLNISSINRFIIFLTISTFVLDPWFLRNIGRRNIWVLSYVNILFCVLYLFDFCSFDNVKESVYEILNENSAEHTFGLRYLISVHHYETNSNEKFK